MRRGVIASGDSRTSAAGAQMLKEGGNAFDAACAAMLAAPLSEPMLTSLGGGGFLLAHEESKKPCLYDFFVDVPKRRAAKRDFYPIDVDFGTTVQEFHIGAASVAVPGVLKGVYEIQQEKGVLPFEAVIQPAVTMATEGIYLSKMQAHLIAMLEPIMTSTPGARALYTRASQLIDHKHLFTNPEYANFLKEFAKSGDGIFYHDEIADTIENMSQELGGDLGRADLKNYSVIQRDPVRFNFRGYEILTNTPPSAGGVLIAFALKLLEHEDLGKFGSLTPTSTPKP